MQAANSASSTGTAGPKGSLTEACSLVWVSQTGSDSNQLTLRERKSKEEEIRGFQTSNKSLVQSLSTQQFSIHSSQTPAPVSTRKLPHCCGHLLKLKGQLDFVHHSYHGGAPPVQLANFPILMSRAPSREGCTHYHCCCSGGTEPLPFASVTPLVATFF